MPATAQQTPIVRQQYLQKLAPFCRALDEALRRSGLAPHEAAEAFSAAVSAECHNCSIPVSGQELWAISQPPSPDCATAKIGRMRLGDCARQGCESFYYHLTFHPYRQLDWPALLSQAKMIEAEQAAPAVAKSASTLGHWTPRLEVAGRITPGAPHPVSGLWDSPMVRRWFGALSSPT